MSKEVFSMILHLLAAAVIERICRTYHMGKEQAIVSFFESEVYQNLEKEETKVWQYSADKVFELYRLEKENGHKELPEY